MAHALPGSKKIGAEMDSESEKPLQNQEEPSKQATPAPSLDGEPNTATKTETEAVNDGDKVWITGIKLWLVMLSITLACFLNLLDTSIIVTAIPRITSDFHSLPDVGWYGSAFQLASAAVQPLSGKLYTYFKTKWTFLVFFGIFELGSLFCGAATSSTMLIVGRAIAGLGTGGLQNGALTILVGAVPLQKRPLLTGIIFGFAQLGVVTGPLLGGALTEYTTWRWCFYINLPIGALVAALIIFIYIPEQVSKPPFRQTLGTSIHALDLGGFVLFARTTVQFLLALQWGGTTYAWNSAVVIGLFCGAGANFLTFLAWNYWRNDDALIPVSMARQRVVWSASLTTVFLFSGLLLTAYFLAIYFQAVLGASPVQGGVNILPGIGGQLVMAVIGGYLVGKMGYYLPFAVAGLVLACLGYGLLTLLSPWTPTAQWAGYQVLAGAGRGLVMQIPYIAVQNALPPSQLSTGISLIAVGMNMGAAVFLTVGNTIFGNSLRSDLPKLAPGVDADAVIIAGATAFRRIVPDSQLPGVLLAFANGVDRVFIMCTALAAAGVVVAWGMGWKDIRTKMDVMKAA